MVDSSDVRAPPLPGLADRRPPFSVCPLLILPAFYRCTNTMMEVRKHVRFVMGLDLYETSVRHAIELGWSHTGWTILTSGT
ncbi:hypothetical protein BD311DRAFT_661076 [Dichomitus squalens]|uniref:Uncharacterized protein n=1 Tax=Dichomitus squalens TaxID=114155 RepID=A0A4Q9MQZ0_9APHY|nr:hypothetical protein BD311DRAFT_661076 [Dichomitus squalens]